MFIHPKSKNRPFHWGPFPLEMLPRNESMIEVESDRSQIDASNASNLIDQRTTSGLLVDAVDRYREIYAGFVDGEVAPAQRRYRMISRAARSTSRALRISWTRARLAFAGCRSARG